MNLQGTKPVQASKFKATLPFADNGSALEVLFDLLSDNFTVFFHSNYTHPSETFFYFHFLSTPTLTKTAAKVVLK